MNLPWPMPPVAFVPGKMLRPEHSPAFDAAAAAPPRTDPDLWAQNPAYIYGARAFDGGFFWEAHEVWEAVWLAARPNSQARALVQGLIQLANACLKVRMNRPKAVARLLALSQTELDKIGKNRIMGLDPGALTQGVGQMITVLGDPPTAQAADQCMIGRLKLEL